MASSLLRMGRIKGVSRPAIAVPFPVLGSTPTTLLDCGANADCQPEWLVQFARHRHRLLPATASGWPDPRVAILTIGEEAGKGNSLVKEACELLEEGDWAEACDARLRRQRRGRRPHDPAWPTSSSPTASPATSC